MSPTADSIVTWLRERVSQGHAKAIVVGLSGGVDSAVVARLSQLALPGRVVGVIMPCHSDPNDEADARLVASHFELPVIYVPLEHAFDSLGAGLERALEDLPPSVGRAGSDDLRAKLPSANLKPRLRMATLYYVANTINGLVAGTGNRSELSIGYFTKYGDGGVDLLPIGGLMKSQVRLLATELGVPARVIEKAPSAGLWLGQTDEAEMGFSYADLEQYLAKGPDAVAPALALRIERLVRQSEHKRALAPVAPTF